jgi:ribonuclease VapC
MIVVDASALVAIALDEPDANRFLQAIAGAGEAIMPAPTALEVHLVLSRRFGPNDDRLTAPLLGHGVIRIVDWTEHHLTLAREAYTRFGGRPARLNFGDCIVYAVAKAIDAPLLYKGEDFARTDIRSAL